MMDKVLVIYKVELEEEDDPSVSTDWNAFTLVTQDDRREILLHDIVSHFTTLAQGLPGHPYYNHMPSGALTDSACYNYVYTAHSSHINTAGKRIMSSYPLVSLADVVPMCPVEGGIRLTLVPCSVGSLVPVRDMNRRQHISRLDLYGKAYAARNPDPPSIGHRCSSNSNTSNSSSIGVLRSKS